MTMHHSIKFGNKMLGSLEDIIWTNTDILTLHSDLTLNAVIHFFLIRPSMVAKGINSSENNDIVLRHIS